ncbi:MAG: PASTA domain-containing protein [Bacteroidetes bacterium]|nr:PASTA domain-containing protein [Bacteroidota bacterium]
MRKKWGINLLLGAGFIGVLVLLLFLWLSFYTRHGVQVEVPNIKGMTLEKAVAALEERDLRFEVSDTIYEERLKPDAVAEQNPAAGSGVKPGRIIYLKVNASGKPMVNMPNLVDKSFTLSKALLKNYGLELGEVTYKYNEYSHNLVIQQFYQGDSIQANRRIERGSVIDLWVTTNKKQYAPDSLLLDTAINPILPDL